MITSTSRPPTDDRPETLTRYIFGRILNPNDESAAADMATTSAAIESVMARRPMPEPGSPEAADLSRQVLRVMAAGMRVLLKCPECRCRALTCEMDETGQHCFDRACVSCAVGCPLEHCRVCNPTESEASE